MQSYIITENNRPEEKGEDAEIHWRVAELAGGTMEVQGASFVQKHHPSSGSAKMSFRDKVKAQSRTIKANSRNTEKENKQQLGKSSGHNTTVKTASD